MQVFLKTFDHQAVRCGWLQTASKVGIHKMSDTRQMNLRIGLGGLNLYVTKASIILVLLWKKLLMVG